MRSVHFDDGPFDESKITQVSRDGPKSLKSKPLLSTTTLEDKYLFDVEYSIFQTCHSLLFCTHMVMEVNIIYKYVQQLNGDGFSWPWPWQWLLLRGDHSQDGHA